MSLYYNKLGIAINTSEATELKKGLESLFKEGKIDIFTLNSVANITKDRIGIPDYSLDNQDISYYYYYDCFNEYGVKILTLTRNDYDDIAIHEI